MKQTKTIRIPKFVTSSTDKVWRKSMIKAIQEQARRPVKEIKE